MNISNFKIDRWYIRIINWYKYTRRGIVDSYCTKYDWLIEIRTGINDYPISCISYPPKWRIGTRGICNHYNAK